VRGWTNDTWAHDCNTAIVEYLDPAHEAAAREGPAVLAAEIEAWEQQLTCPPDAQPHHVEGSMTVDQNPA
jgi:hypothetical protein